ncbi:MAG: hypothetical protein B6D64_04335 [Bacteroidetes bacterium 4484_276]|nr:MAG: hypothetical protein B6D64_04335 [Bacteroidetes bacterium 4484_276]OYT13381.1 MAG: hypothetical protein B6I19_05425 [Bacteroidetes bacterium 4572_114]
MPVAEHLKKYFILILLILTGTLVSTSTFAQKKTKINLIDANELIGQTVNGVELNIFVGNVVFEHDSAYLYCDSAVFSSAQNNLRAYKNVHIFISDTLSLYSDELDYSGNTRVATMTGNVKLVDNDATLTTDRLIYGRNTGIAYYSTGGKIVNEDNVLTSRRGYYYTDLKDIYFKEDVVFDNPEYHLVSDSLIYNTATEIADISGPTTITGEDELLYAEDGWYDAKSDRAKLKIWPNGQNPYLSFKEQYLSGDSIYYDKEAGIGQAFSNVFLKDSLQNMIVTGNFADYRRQDGFAFITDSAQAIFIDKKDSLYMHSDTLKLIFDSLQSPFALQAFYKTKYYKTDMQGMCDSLVYMFADSTISMFGQPALWTQENQLTANKIKIFSSGQKIDSMQMTNLSFIISTDKFDIEKFNQIKGRDMVGYFEDNELNKINVQGNSETIYFVREEDGALIGINKALASNMSIIIGDRQLTDIFYYDKPDAHLIPESSYPEQELKLKNFKWLGTQRPNNRYDIFKWDGIIPVLN